MLVHSIKDVDLVFELVMKVLCQLPMDTSDVVQGNKLSTNTLQIHLRLFMGGARIGNGATIAPINISDDRDPVR